MNLKEIVLASSMLFNQYKDVSYVPRLDSYMNVVPITTSDIKLDVNDGIYSYLQHLDMRITSKGIDKGLAEEGNPVAVALFGKNMEKRNSAAIFKYALATTGVGLTIARNLTGADVPNGILIPANLLYGLIVMNNTKVAEEDMARTPIAVINF